MRASLVGMLTLAMTHQREKWPEVIAANEALRAEAEGLKARAKTEADTGEGA